MTRTIIQVETELATTQVTRDRLKQQLKSNSLSEEARATIESELATVFEALAMLKQEKTDLRESAKPLLINKNSEADDDTPIDEGTAMVVTSLVSKENIYWVSEEDAFLRYEQTAKRWAYNTQKALRTKFPILRNKKAWQCFEEVLDIEKRNVDFVGSSFKKLPPSYVNTMVKGDWIVPNLAPSPNKKWWDYMLYSVCGGKEENIQHLKEVIGWKYDHPECFSLPVLGIYGEGQSGKNLFCETVLKAIFLGNWTKANFKSIERFAEIMVGNAIVHIDDNPTPEEMSWLKAHSSTETAQIEPKGRKSFLADATWLLVVTAQTSPFKIARDGSERRFSLIKTTHNFPTIVGRGEGIISVNEKIGATEKSEAQDKVSALIAEANINVFRNPIELAHFLGMCVTESRKLATHPKGHHGTDFAELVQNQASPLDEVLEEVFTLDPTFDHITLPVIFNLYLQRTKQLNPNAPSMKAATVSDHIEEYLRYKSLDHKIKRSNGRIPVGQGNARQVKNVFYSVATHGVTCKSIKFSTDQYYEDGYHLLNGSGEPVTDSTKEIHKVAQLMLKSSRR